MKTPKRSISGTFMRAPYAADMKKFKAIMARGEFTSKMFEKFATTDYGFKYNFDGYLECAIVYSKGKLYDFVDINHEEIENPKNRAAEMKTFNTPFANINVLAKNTQKMLDPNNM